jgi:hypothetical protein
MRIEHGNIKYHNTDFYKSDIEEMCVVKNKGIVVLSDLKKQVKIFQDYGKGYLDYGIFFFFFFMIHGHITHRKWPNFIKKEKDKINYITVRQTK